MSIACSVSQSFQRGLKLSDALPEGRFFLHHLGDALEAVDDGGVIAAPKRAPDLDELHAEELAHQEHGDLARDREVLRARLRSKPFRRDTPVFGDRLLN